MLSSKLLRCDATSCGGTALDEMADLAGVESLTAIPDPASPGAVIAYDEGSISKDRVVSHITAIIGALRTRSMMDRLWSVTDRGKRAIGVHGTSRPAIAGRYLNAGS